jgi:hypothetical protein
MVSRKPLSVESGTLTEIASPDVLNLPQLAADPIIGVNGDMYFNTVSQRIRIYDGSATAWKNL